MAGPVSEVLDRPLSDVLERTAMAALLLLPLGLLYSRAVAEIMIAITDGLFLWRSLLQRDWRWLRRPWFVLASLWWAWLILCSAPLFGLGPFGWRSLAQALMFGRFFVFVAALENAVLAAAAPRRWVYGVIAISAGWIMIEAWQQHLFGHNIFGDPRWGDGELTGPFFKPRAGAPLALLLFPSLLGPVTKLLEGHSWPRRIGGAALGLFGGATIILIGQRMPVLLTGFGVVAAAALLPRLRFWAGGGIVAGTLLLAATPVISPHTYYRLVEKFSTQMEHFGASPYGLLYQRATVMAEHHPAFGLGFDGFRYGCSDPSYFHRVAWLGWLGRVPADGGGAAACNLHPHNFYFQAAVEGGFLGLGLFTALGIAWLKRLFEGLWRDPKPLPLALFIAALLHLWPLASTDAFASMPMAGWFFLLLGWGLAEQRNERA